MRVFQVVLCILALTILSTQTFRHVYVKWIQPRDSILDQYDENVEKDIKESKSIEDLLIQYDKSFKIVKDYEKNPKNKKIDFKKRKYTEPYKTKIKLEKAIKKWERYDLQIQKLRFYWFCGLISILLGFFVYSRIDQWLGMIGIITGFSEMIFWTFPVVFGIFGSKVEFERLLNNKLIFSIISWALLIFAWFAMYKIKGKKRGNSAT